MDTSRFDLADDEWAVIAPLLPKRVREPGRVDDRKVLNGILYILRIGAPWRDLPERCGPHRTIYNRRDRWAARRLEVDLRCPGERAQ
jgi:transposase